MFKKILIYLLFFIPINLIANDSEHINFNKVDWHFEGVRGSFDRQSIQRGFKIFKEVCSACHSLKRVAFRNLRDIGFSENEVKVIAAGYSIVDGPNDEGEMFERPGKASDHLPAPYPNDQAARAVNNKVLPPDLSLMIKAREDGANYIYSLITGYSEPPIDVKIPENMYYNPYFAGGKIAMPPPLKIEGQVEYVDGVRPTVDQMTKDVVNFLQWAAEPEMEKRKGLGFKVTLFIIVLTFLFILAKRRIWKRVK